MDIFKSQELDELAATPEMEDEHGPIIPHMNLDNYQSLAGRTAGAGTETQKKRLVTAALGLAGEAGEFANLVKKMTAHGHPLDVEALTDELGDVMWYLAEAATTLDVWLSDIGKQNIAKLRQRYPDGFNFEASINRGQDNEK